jgi:hypothetical protein
MNALPDCRCRLPALTCLAAAALGATLLAPPPGRAADWPFAPLSRPAVPAVPPSGWTRNPIDAFVLAHLEKAGLRPNPPADRLTLLRRVTFDLTGLAPTPAERAAFLADHAPDAYERLVDRLLGSPHFGERWAQHWLDVVRYAETEGFKVDRLRPDAYRYRDYVIRAFNDDLPYDRFVRQQLAGDELEPDNPDALVATGFLRLHPEESVGSNYRQERQDILNDVTDVFGSTFLGLTIECARCHDHKFDPILQKDYYRLQAFFAPITDRDDLPLMSHAAQERYHQRLAAWEAATRPIRVQIDAMLAPLRKQIFDEVILQLDPETQAALRTPPGHRTPLQQELAALASKQLIHRQNRARLRLAPAARKKYDALRKRLARYDSLKPPEMPVAMAVVDNGPEAPAVYRLATGNYLKPKEQVQPGFPKFLDPRPPVIQPPAERPDSTGRRSALANWLCRPDHPLTSRVIANRVWQHYLGEGIVATPNDFGSMGESAADPELLDYLAAELVRHGWHLKALHRLIVTSATYRQSSRPELNPTRTKAAKADPDNHLLWHARVKRREGEALRDLILQASGRLNLRMFGLSAQPELPPSVQTDDRYAWDPDEKVEDRNRRSIYVFARRNLAYPLFAAFDEPDRVNSCPVRPVTVTAPQALVMLNGEFALTQARRMGGRLLAEHGTDTQALVRAAYLALYGREPAADEVTAAEQFLDRQTKVIAAGAPPGKDALPDPVPTGMTAARAAAVVDLCHALMNTAEFQDVE